MGLGSSETFYVLPGTVHGIQINLRIFMLAEVLRMFSAVFIIRSTEDHDVSSVYCPDI